MDMSLDYLASVMREKTIIINVGSLVDSVVKQCRKYFDCLLVKYGKGRDVSFEGKRWNCDYCNEFQRWLEFQRVVGWGFLIFNF